MPQPSPSPGRSAIRGCALLTLLLPACVATPDHQDRGLLAGTQRVLALDFGRKATGPRVNRFQRLPASMGTEMQRARGLLTLGKTPVTRSAGDEMQRTRNLSARALQGFSAEANRRPTMPTGVVPSSFEFSRETANNLDTAIRFFGMHKQPMGELSDKQHRTDHRDVRPEATLWQRFVRRFPFF